MFTLRQILQPALLLAVLLLVVAAPPASGRPVPGAPLQRLYGVEHTQSAPGHLAIATASDGSLLVGNIEGVLQFDGVEWRLITLPGRTPVRALATGADGQLYLGSYDTFGRLVKNGDGDFIYEELLTRAGLRGGQRHVGIVWETHPTRDGIYFHAEQHLHFVPYGEGPAKRWPLPDGLRSFYVADDRLYARVEGRGFCRFEDGKLVPEPGAAAFAHQPLPGLVDLDDGLLLVGREGLFRADEKGIARIEGPASRLLASIRGYVVQPLPDGSFAVGTLDGELVRFGRDLQVRERLDLGGFGIQDFGLDREGGLWVATEGNLVRLSLPSPWSFLGEKQGLAGSPTDFEWYDGALWLASTNGLSRMRAEEDGQVHVERLPWTDLEASALHADDAGLLVGLREGLRALDPGATEPRTVFDDGYNGVYGLLESRYDPHRIYAIAGTKLLVVTRVDGRWQLAAEIPLQGIAVFGMVEGREGELWFGDTRGPVQRWTIDPRTNEVTARDVYGDAQGLAVDADAGTSVYRLDDTIHAISDQTGFRFDGERFVDDTAAPFALVDRPWELQVEETPLGAYAFTTRELWHRPPGATEWQPVSPGSEAVLGYTWLRVNRDGVLRVATWSGLLQFQPTEQAPKQVPLKLTMESVVARAPEGASHRLPSAGGEPVQVPPGHSLNLRFAMVSMESGAEFRYLLHGVMPEWSAWTDRELFIRTLPAGDYRLDVEARTRNGRQTARMTYAFRVERHWYEQWWTIALGAVAAIALATAFTLWIVRRRTERYLAANRRLEGRIAERTRELEDLNRQLAELVTEDALTGVANRRALESGLRREWFRCLDQRRPLSVLMIDVDHFKAYNDAHGHLEGDVQLRGIAQRLRQQHDPQRELLARYGGEEFALLLPGIHPEEALRRAELIRAAIAGSDVGMTVSIGVAGGPPDLHAEPDSLLRRADAALYAAKRAGRNRVQADGA
jgi:diguanylate cyclase (GGDEF)-like protein